MKFKICLILLLCAASFSCSRKEEVQQSFGKLSLVASVDSQPESKTYMPNGKTEVFWTKNDRLIVYGIKNSDIKQDVLSPDFTTACKSGVFSTESWPDGYTPIYALNANGAIDSLKNLTCSVQGKIRTLINPVQKIANNGSYGQSASSSIGKVSGTEGSYSISTMMNIPSLLKLTVTREDISEIKIESLGDEILAGYVDVDYASLSASHSDFWSEARGEKSIVVSAVGSAASSGCFIAGNAYYACILPQTYEQGLRITMTATDGKVGIREIDKTILMRRDTIRSFINDIDKDIEFKELRTKKTLDFSSVSSGTFQYSLNDVATNLPQRTSAYIADGTDFWGTAYPLYKFNGAVRFWNTGGGALNAAAGTYVRFPRISGYKLTSITDFVVVHSAERNYKITAGVASSYDDGVAVKGGEAQGLSKSSSAASFVLKDKYDATKDYYIVCNSESGFRFKLVYTPDDQLDPEPVENSPVSVARWRIKKTNLTEDKLNKWSNSNTFVALSGDYENTAYISTSDDAKRDYYEDQLAVNNIKSGSYIQFNVPVNGLAAGSTVDFMTTLRPTSYKLPKYWIFEYLDGGEWKTVADDLRTASDDGNIKYSMFMTTANQLFTTFCQNFTVETGIAGEGLLKMRVRAVGTKNCNGGEISASVSNNLCFASYSNYYVACEIAIYRNIAIKDTKKIAFVGNSYTYYNGSAFMFKQLARSQGHDARIRVGIKGGEDMSFHVTNPHVLDALEEGGYDYAYLQESCLYVAKYYDGTRPATYTNCKNMADKVKEYNPSAKCIFEDSWACPTSSQDWRGYGSYDAYQRSILGGSLTIAEKTSSWISPVGISFKRAYHDGFTALWSTADYTHPSINGSYLKACTLYYLIYGETFDSNVPDCGINAATAKLLREYARNAVLDNNNRAKSQDPKASDVDNF